jgi:hypothetical protein
VEQLALEFGEAKAERRRERERRIQEDFERFHAACPEVFALYCRFAEELLAAGHTRGSSDWILGRIRWFYKVDSPRPGGFKINDHFTSRYARLLIRTDPRFKGFFELRELRSE